MKRTATAIWKGSGKNGSGTISTQSGALHEASYAYNTRFDYKQGTNPEELIAAAHAGCFTMKLSFLLSEAGFVPAIIETEAEITLGKDSISRSHLSVKATAPGLNREKFLEYAENAKTNCPVSKALKMDITLEAELSEKIMA